MQIQRHWARISTYFITKIHFSNLQQIINQPKYPNPKFSYSLVNIQVSLIMKLHLIPYSFIIWPSTISSYGLKLGWFGIVPLRIGPPLHVTNIGYNIERTWTSDMFLPTQVICNMIICLAHTFLRLRTTRSWCVYLLAGVMIPPHEATEYLYELCAIVENIVRERCETSEVHPPTPS